MTNQPVLFEDLGPIGGNAKHCRLTGQWLDPHTHAHEFAKPPYLDVVVIAGKAWPTNRGYAVPNATPLFLTPDGNIMVSELLTFEPEDGELDRVGIA